MAKEYYDKEINKNTDWGGDESTENLPVSGRRVQEFIKKSLDGKAGVFYYDTANNRYLVFADEQNRDTYLENPTQIDLILGTFDAPFNYTAEINLTTPTYVAILAGSTGNYIDFTFDTKNKQGQSVGEGVICTYSFIRGSVKKTVSQKYKYGTAVHFNIDEYLLEGTNTILVGIMGQNTLAATTVSVTYQVVNLSLTDSFDFAEVHNLAETPDDTLAIPYTISGAGTKTMEWYLDGVKLEFIKNEDEIVETTSTRTKYISIAGLSQGRHDIQMRAFTMINEEKFYSQTLYRDFIVYKIENLKEIIAVALTLPIGQEIITGDTITLEGVSQYIPYEIKFATFNPSASTSNVKISIDDTVVASMASENGVQNTYSLLLTDYGRKVLKISTGTSEYIITMDVAKSDTTLAEITEGLQLDLQAIGKSNNSSDKDSWTYGDYETSFSGFSWNKISGWVNNRLLISNGASISVNIAPLNVDALILGKTLEFEFATRNVSDDNAVVCDLRGSNGVGLLITASEVTLKSAGGAELTTKYKSEENIRISLVINKKAGTTNKLMAFIYINGVISGAVNFAATDNFLSSKSLSFASSADVDIELKQLRFYDVALTSDQILNNYILYRDTAEELISLYDKNNIYGEDGYSFSTDILSGQLPIMIITGDIPALENTTDKNKEIVVDVEYINLQDQKRSFKVKNGIMRPQGTSSMSYPKKNFRLYTTKRDDTVLYDSDDRVVSDRLYAFKEGAQPVNCWCMKADYAESSGTHNTGIARLWNEIMINAQIDGQYICRTEAQKKAKENSYPYDVRTTVDGFPILIFYRLTSEDDLIFIGKYNFNNDKSTESVFGFEGIPGFDNSRMQCWEVLNNGHHLALFQDVNNFDEEWEDAFEARYPDVGSDADTTDLKAFATWLVSTKDDIEKFKTEKWDHLDVYKIAAYYIYFMRFGAVDQTVKNAMFTSEDGEHFYYINYDNDTINGVRNDGLLIYGPTIDRQSLDDSFTTTVYAYAGHDSTLWNNLEADEEFMEIVSKVDNALFSAGLSYQNVIEMFDTKQCDMWCERIYNQDAQYKYIGPYTDSGVNNLYMLQGKRKAHRRWWLSRRFNYLDSKFVSGDYKSNTFEIKLAGAPIGIEFSITAGFDMNYGYGVNNVPIETGVPLNEGESHTFTTKQVLNIGDPLRIYSAVNLKEIDVHNFIEYLSTISVDKVYNEILGTKLKKLILGVDVSSDGRRNTSISEISGLRAAQRLEYLDISGYQGMTNLDLTPFNYFTTLKAFQSGLTSVDFAEGALLSLAELPETLQALTLNSVNITPANLKIENTWASIRYMDIRNCANFRTNFTYFQKWYKEKSVSNSESTLIVHGINWSNLTCAELIELGQLKLDGGTLELKGRIRLTDSTQEEVNTLREIFGANCFNPSNDLYISAPDAIYITGPSEIYDGDTVQYSAAVFSEYRGTVTFSIVSGNDGSFTINEETGVLVSTEKGRSTSITIRVTHRPTQGVPTSENLVVRVKARVYPTLTIKGSGAISKQYTDFTLDYSPTEYNGTFTVQWSLSGDAVGRGLIRISSQTQKKCTIELIGQPMEVSDALLTVKMTKNFGGTQNFIKTLSVVAEGVIMTSSSNPKVMEICYAQGWCSSPDKMTEDEAAAVSSIGTVFRNITDTAFTFDEFQYFVGVSSLNSYAFQRSIIESIKFPIGLTTIGSHCFDYSYLKEVIIDANSTITTINGDAFANCKYLENIYINKDLSLGESVFDYSYDSLRNVSLKVKNIPKNAFRLTGYVNLILIDTETIDSYGLYFFGLSEANKYTIKLPSSLKYFNALSFGNPYPYLKIEVDASSKYYKQYGDIILNYDEDSLIFKRFEDNEVYTVPRSIKKLEDYCFVNKKATNNIILHDEVTKLGAEAFSGLNILSIEIPASVTYIGSSCFKLCANLAEITIPETVTTIGNSAFSYCSSLKNVNYLSGYKIPSSCFSYCKELVTFVAPNAIGVESRAFYSCSALVNANFDNITYIGNYAFGECSSLTTFDVPDNVTLIDDNCFNSCTDLTSLNFSENSKLEEIGDTFINGTAIQTINIPKSVNNVSYAFYRNKSILVVNFHPEGVLTGLSVQDFRNSSITEITLPKSLASIASYIFAGCLDLKLIRCYSKEVNVNYHAFGSSTSDYTGRNTYNKRINKLIVPAGSTGYDTGQWLDPLCNPNKCGFTLVEEV